MSALLTTTMPYMKVVIDTLKEKGMREELIVLVGGAPLNEEFGAAVGADAYCRDAGHRGGNRTEATGRAQAQPDGGLNPGLSRPASLDFVFPRMRRCLRRRRPRACFPSSRGRYAHRRW